jgi:hypothetical protein
VLYIKHNNVEIMLTYYTDKPNSYTIRTAPITGSSIVLQLENMFTFQKVNATLTDVLYTDYESILQFTASIPSAKQSDEWRAEIRNGDKIVWNGSIQSFKDTVAEKSEYETQTTQYKSAQSTNEYIVQ